MFLRKNFFTRYTRVLPAHEFTRCLNKILELEVSGRSFESQDRYHQPFPQITITPPHSSKSMADNPQLQTLTIAVTGPSSSGKTTLSRLLKHVFDELLPSTTILHVDDFYLSDSQIPVRTVKSSDDNNTPKQLQDWDSPESLNFPALLSTLRHVKRMGAFPADFKSLEEHDASQREVLERALGTEVVKDLTRDAKVKLQEGSAVGNGGKRVRRVTIVDGFLLLGKDVPEDIISEFDVKIFLRAPYEKAKHRRESRQGYVTIEGSWEDPPGYFDDIVWPGYVAQHEYLFTDKDVERGSLTEEAARKGIISSYRDSGDELSLEELARWAIGEVLTELVNLSYNSVTGKQ